MGPQPSPSGSLIVPDARMDDICRHGDPRWVIRRAGEQYPANEGQIMLGHARTWQFAARSRV